MKGDFLGFSFDGIHCSQLGITHVSSSDRYDEALFPEVKDKTIEIPNNHGEYYYGSVYGTRTFEIDIAYDSVTETQFRNIRRLFGTRKICELIFDERPYKVYYAKIESPIEMSYVCFDEPKKVEDNQRDGVRRDREHDQEYMPGGQIIDSVVVPAGEELSFKLTRIPNDTPILEETEVESSYDSTTYTYTFTNNTENDIEVTITYNTNEIPYIPAWEQVTPWKYEDGVQRIYKGEGKISLICYQPFAHQLFKIRELYERAGENQGNLVTTYTNVDEWIESSGILNENTYNSFNIDRVVECGAPYTYAISVYNPGDLDVGFCLYIPFVNGKIEAKANNTDIVIHGDTEVLVLKSPIKQKDDNDTGILIDTRTHLIEGVKFSQIANVNDYRTLVRNTTGTLYNECIKIGEFPYIKRNDWRLDTINNRPQAIYISCKDNNTQNVENYDSGIRIYYDYLYF